MVESHSLNRSCFCTVQYIYAATPIVDLVLNLCPHCAFEFPTLVRVPGCLVVVVVVVVVVVALPAAVVVAVAAVVAVRVEGRGVVLVHLRPRFSPPQRTSLVRNLQ